MLEKLAFVFTLLCALVIFDGRKLKNMDVKAYIGYGIIMVPVIYLAIIFVLGKGWPNYTDMLRYIFGGPAKEMVKFLKVPQ